MPPQFRLRSLFILTTIVAVLSAIAAKVGVAQFALGVLFTLYFVAINATLLLILWTINCFTDRFSVRHDSAKIQAPPPKK